MILLLVSVLTGFLLVGAVVHGSLRARAAADTAALAGAGALLDGRAQGEACAVAAELADANGAHLDRCELLPGTAEQVTAHLRVEVVLRVDVLGGLDARAVAHAGAVPARGP